MTYPHIEQESKTVKLNVPDYLTPEHQAKVRDINNAVMETVLVCGLNRDCLNCGNEDCLKVFEAQAELQGMTLKELMESWRKQRELDEKAAEAQAKRFAYYEQKYLEGLVTDKKEKTIKEVNLFNFEKAA